MVYIATQYPHYGYYPEGAQHINTPHATHRTPNRARGLDFLNESFIHPSTGVLVTYAAWCADLALKGTKMIRLIWGGRNQPWTNAYNLEPPPYGTYNVWHSALNDSNLTTFRSHQVSGSPGDGTFPIAYWTGSNIKALLDACEANGIEVIVELSHNNEFSVYWAYHPWNYSNRYMSGVACATQDKGFLSDNRLFYSNAQAIQAMKDRISFVINLIGSYKCVCMWGICSEGIWAFAPDFWGEPALNATVISRIRNEVVPWYAEIASYIRSEDVYNRPIMVSVARTPGTGVWSTDPDHYANVMAEPFLAYPIDVIGANIYESSFENSIQHINLVREKFHPKQVLIHQYWPFNWIGNPGGRAEYPPYTESKRIEWIGAVIKWSTGPGRWMGLIESANNNVWSKGGYADPDWYSIGAVTATFRGYINWKDWSGAEDWADNISSTGLNYSLTTGDGDHFVGVLVWTSSGAKTLTISNVTDGAWTFRVFDWTTGSVDATTTPTASGNSVDVSVTPSNSYQAVVLGSKD